MAWPRNFAFGVAFPWVAMYFTRTPLSGTVASILKPHSPLAFEYLITQDAPQT